MGIWIRGFLSNQHSIRDVVILASRLVRVGRLKLNGCA